MDNLTIDSTTLPNLTFDLITKILLRLPPKPLARFKCVSKQWNSLITSRRFILTHIARSAKILSNLQMARIDCPKLYTLPLTACYPPSSLTVMIEDSKKVSHWKTDDSYTLFTAFRDAGWRKEIPFQKKRQ